MAFDQTAGQHSLAKVTLKGTTTVCKSKEKENEEFHDLSGFKLLCSG